MKCAVSSALSLLLFACGSESSPGTTVDAATPDTAASTCNVGGTEVEAGAPSPDNACQICDPDSAGGFVDAPDGAACPGGVCEAGVCQPSCVIDGVTVSDGSANPANACQVCDVAASASSWSSLSDATACATGGYCANGACVTGCLIDGAVVAEAGVNPANACQRCSAATNLTAWSNADDGATCTGGLCSEGACAPGCFINGVFVAAGKSPEGSVCQVCDPARSTTAWSPVADGVGCTGGGCAAGECAPGCVIDGVFVAPDAVDPTEPCRVCVPDLSTSAWSPKPNGDACGADLLCWTGVCSAGCLIDGAWYAPDAVNPTDPCQTCSPVTAKTSWTTRANGSDCGGGQICNAGTCGFGCYIGGAFVEPGGTVGTACQRCEPAQSTSATVAAPDGTLCGAGLVCAAGSCNPGCYIDGALVNVGAIDPTSVCRSCDNTISVTAYSNDPNGTVCGSGEICNDGVCSAGCWVSNTFYAAGQGTPFNPCQACTPAISTTSFTTKAPGSQCAGGTCLGENCISAPSLFGVAPACTANDGGRAITLTGLDFVTGAKVTIAGVPATDVVVTDTQTVKAVTPATPNLIGNVAVTVANAFGETTTSTTLFGLYDPFAFGAPQATSTSPNLPYLIKVGDVDGDGKDDLVFIEGTVVTIKRQGSSLATFGASSTYEGCSNPATVAIADADEDGRNDVLVTCDTKLHFLKGASNAAPAFVSTTELGHVANRIEVCNVDGDDFPDVAITVTGSNLVRIFRGDGDGTFTAGPTINFTDEAGYLTVGDVDADGFDDVAAGNYDAAKLRVAVTTGPGTFGSPLSLTIPSLQTVQLAKIDGDDRADLLVTSADGEVSASFYLSLESGGFGPRVKLTNGGLYGATAADFNGDAIADVLVSGGTGMRVFPGNGDGTFSCLFEVPLFQGSYDLIPADFDGNGALDIVTNNPSFQNYVVIMNGQ